MKIHASLLGVLVSIALVSCKTPSHQTSSNELSFNGAKTLATSMGLKVRFNKLPFPETNGDTYVDGKYVRNSTGIWKKDVEVYCSVERDRFEYGTDRKFIDGEYVVVQNNSNVDFDVTMRFGSVERASSEGSANSKYHHWVTCRYNSLPQKTLLPSDLKTAFGEFITVHEK